MKLEKKNYSRVYLEKCKYKTKKKNMVRFTDVELLVMILNNCIDLLTGVVIAKTSNLSLNKTSLGETGCLSSPYFLLIGCLGIQFFDSPFPQYSQLGYLWLPTSHSAALA